jgi:hypothetical protein
MRKLLTVFSLTAGLLAITIPISAQEAQKTDLSTNRLQDAQVTILDTTSVKAADDAQAAWKASQDFFIDKVGSVEPTGRFDVSPTLFELHATPGETITQTIYVISTNPDPTTYYLSVEDYEGTTDSSKSHRLLGISDSEYGARHWANLPVEEFTLELGERANIKVTFEVPATADPGEHYAAVLVARAPRAAEIEGDAQVSIVSRVGTMFMIDIAGQTKLDGVLEDFSLARNPKDGLNKIVAQAVGKAPVDFNVTYKNAGTTHLSPQGTLEITNIFGKTIEVINPDATTRSGKYTGTTALSIDRFNVLRGSVRAMILSNSYTDREIPLFFGPYTAKLTLDDGTGIAKGASVHFWYIPCPQTPIIAGVVILLIVFFIVKKKSSKKKSILN